MVTDEINIQKMLTELEASRLREPIFLDMLSYIDIMDDRIPKNLWKDSKSRYHRLYIVYNIIITALPVTAPVCRTVSDVFELVAVVNRLVPMLEHRYAV